MDPKIGTTVLITSLGTASFPFPERSGQRLGEPLSMKVASNQTLQPVMEVGLKRGLRVMNPGILFTG
jgi:hypothetical protein